MPHAAGMWLAFLSTYPAPAGCRRHCLRAYGRIAIIRDAVRPKPLCWMGSSQSDLARFPQPVMDVIGAALRAAQNGEKHANAKPLRGFHGAGVLEVISDFDGNAYRAVYTVRFSDAVYTLHVFQKKSKRGIQTPRRDLALVRQRYKRAEQLHEQQSD